MTGPPTYHSVKITGPARDALRKVSLRLGHEVGQSVTLSDALIASLMVSEQHATAVVVALDDVIPEPRK